VLVFAGYDARFQSDRLLVFTGIRNHPKTAVCLSNLGLACCANGDEVTGLDYLRRSVEIVETFLPDDHPYRPKCVRNYSESLRKAGYEDEANAIALKIPSVDSPCHDLEADD